MRRALHDVTTTDSNGVDLDAASPRAPIVNEAPSYDEPADAMFGVGSTGSAARAVGGFPLPVVTATGLPARPTADVVTTSGNDVDTDATGTRSVTAHEGASVAGQEPGTWSGTLPPRPCTPTPRRDGRARLRSGDRGSAPRRRPPG
jgi:hypothetical protein